MTDFTQSYGPQAEGSQSVSAFAEGGSTIGQVDADIGHVLDVLVALGARPLQYCSPQSARRQPQMADAVAAILGRQDRASVDDGVESADVAIASGESQLKARLYRPLGLLSRLNPVVLYFHGGGFITGNLDSHDASARALARRTGAIVVSLDYRLAPEHAFPAAHEDAWAAWRWLIRSVRDLGGDARRMAVAGEDAGANLAAHVALRARDEHVTQPVHQLLIHPIAGRDMDTSSYGQTQQTQPIGAAAMRWRFRHLLDDQAQLSDPRLDLVSRTDLTQVAPATILLAEIDPLRAEGEALAEALQVAGVPVECWTYDGVMQGFFGLGVVVTKAMFAQSDAAEALSKAFATSRLS